MCNQGNKSHIFNMLTHINHTSPIYTYKSHVSNILTVTNIPTGANKYAGKNLTYLKLRDVCRIKILFLQNRMAGLLQQWTTILQPYEALVYIWIFLRSPQWGFLIELKIIFILYKRKAKTCINKERSTYMYICINNFQENAFKTPT